MNDSDISTDDFYISAMKNIFAMQKSAEKNGYKNVTLEKINKEIEDYRKSVAKNGDSLLSD